jgi:hypothetical protein
MYLLKNQVQKKLLIDTLTNKNRRSQNPLKFKIKKPKQKYKTKESNIFNFKTIYNFSRFKFFIIEKLNLSKRELNQ